MSHHRLPVLNQGFTIPNDASQGLQFRCIQHFRFQKSAQEPAKGNAQSGGNTGVFGYERDVQLNKFVEVLDPKMLAVNIN